MCTSLLTRAAGHSEDQDKDIATVIDSYSAPGLPMIVKNGIILEANVGTTFHQAGGAITGGTADDGVDVYQAE